MMSAIIQDIKRFERYLRVTRSLNAHNVKSYYHYPLMSFVVPFCEEREVDSVESLTTDLVDELVMSVQTRTKKNGDPLSPASRVAYLKALKMFVKWASEEGASAEAGRIGIPALKKQRKNLLTPGEQQRLEAAARTERDRLIIALMLETGTRESGIANLKGNDLLERDRRTWFTRTTDKTGTRLAPISRDLYRSLVAYRDGPRRPRTKSEFLFMSDRLDRHSHRYEPIGLSGIYRAIKLAAARAELEPERAKPHALRACAITRMLNKGMHPALVSEIVGVSIAVISKHYAYPSPDEIWNAAALARGE